MLANLELTTSKKKKRYVNLAVLFVKFSWNLMRIKKNNITYENSGGPDKPTSK